MIKNNKITMGFFLIIGLCISIILDEINLVFTGIVNLGIIELISTIAKIKKKSSRRIHLPFYFGFIILFLLKYFIKNKIVDKTLIIKLIIISSLNDIFQELFGKLYGSIKVTRISPNKTLEGYFGGYISILLLNSTIFKNKFKFLNLVYFSNIFGDLFFSYLKRSINIKDYSKILGDHGGILDRFDSFIIPTFIMAIAKICKLNISY